MERDFAAYLFTLFCPLFTSGASFSIAHEYSVRNLNRLPFSAGVVFQAAASNDSPETGTEESSSSHVCDICQRKFEDERVFETHKKLHSRLQTVYQRK